MGNLLPFKVVLRRAAMEDFSAAAPKKHAPTVYLTEEKKECDGSKKQVERFMLLGSYAKKDAEHEEYVLAILQNTVLIAPRVRGVGNEPYSDGQQKPKKPCAKLVRKIKSVREHEHDKCVTWYCSTLYSQCKILMGDRTAESSGNSKNNTALPPLPCGFEPGAPFTENIAARRIHPPSCM